MKLIVSFQNNNHHYLTYEHDHGLLNVQNGEGIDENQVFVISTDARSLDELKLGLHDFRIKPFSHQKMIVIDQDEEVHVMKPNSNYNEMILRLNPLNKFKSMILIKNDEDSHFENGWAVHGENGIEIVKHGSHKEKITNSWEISQVDQDFIVRSHHTNIEVIEISDDEKDNIEIVQVNDSDNDEDSDDNEEEPNTEIDDEETEDEDESTFFMPPITTEKQIHVSKTDARESKTKPSKTKKSQINNNNEPIDFDQMTKATQQSLEKLEEIDQSFETNHQKLRGKLEKTKNDNEKQSILSLIRQNIADRTQALRTEAIRQNLYKNEPLWFINKFQNEINQKYANRKLTYNESQNYEMEKLGNWSRYIGKHKLDEGKDQSDLIKYYPDYLLRSTERDESGNVMYDESGNVIYSTTEENEPWLTRDTIKLPKDWTLTFNVGDIKVRLHAHQNNLSEIEEKIEKLDESMLQLDQKMITQKPDNKEFDQLEKFIHKLQPRYDEYENLKRKLEKSKKDSVKHKSLEKKLLELKDKAEEYVEIKEKITNMKSTKYLKLEKKWLDFEVDKDNLLEAADKIAAVMEELQNELDERGPISSLLADMEDDMDDEEREEMDDDNDEIHMNEFDPRIQSNIFDQEIDPNLTNQRYKSRQKKIVANYNVDWDEDTEMETELNKKIEARLVKERIIKAKAEAEKAAAKAVAKSEKAIAKAVAKTVITKSSLDSKSVASLNPKKRRIQPTAISDSSSEPKKRRIQPTSI